MINTDNKTISIVAAIADNNAIGFENKLPWYLPADLKWFKKLTTGHVVIMGRNTFESLPEKFKPLPNRINVVLTTNKDYRFTNCKITYSIDDVMKACDPKNENFVIGGASVYRAFLPLANKLYLTRIHHSFEADTFFPEINYDDWDLIMKEDYSAKLDNPFDYSFQIFKKL